MLQAGKGGNEAAVLRLWREKRARGFFPLLSQPDTRAPPFFVDELDAGGHRRFGFRHIGFVSQNKRDPNVCRRPPLHAQGGRLWVDP